ncbi:hypothetical protein Cgig2_032188 [Carnegiea gigantea]|uniref:Zinc finger protein 346 n=1 Tax=Carnegiea gigantea TaxID=171969 RepID=A0A9Q1JIB6_9CARY|nr:hypothetical protein Cgig2_032188 [Carnegiea gigantea]
MDYQEPSHLAAYPPGYHPRVQPHFQFYPPHQNPPLNPNPNPSFDHHHRSPFHYGVASLPPPIRPPSPAVGEPTYPVNHGGGYVSQAAVYGGDYNAGCGGLPSYYHDPNWAANARFEDPRSVLSEDYRSNPVRYPNATSNSVRTNTAQQFVATSYNHNVGNTRKIRHQGKISAKKSLKKTKIPQSVRCDVCKIVCDTKDVLKKHRSGKKHKQNLEKLKAVVAGKTTIATATTTTNSATPGPEAPDTCKSLNARTKRKKASLKAGDLETKKQRVLEGGAAMDAVRTCSICKVVCNSETVFQYHLAGQKHAAMVKKQASGTAAHTASSPAT